MKNRPRVCLISLALAMGGLAVASADPAGREQPPYNLLAASALSWITGEETPADTAHIARYFGLDALPLEPRPRASKGPPAPIPQPQILGNAFLNRLTRPQRQELYMLLGNERNEVAGILKRRESIVHELDRLRGGTVVEGRKILELAAGAGRLDGEVAVMRAESLAKLKTSLSETQVAEFRELRERKLRSLRGTQQPREIRIEQKHFSEEDRKQLRLIGAAAFTWITGSDKLDAYVSPYDVANVFGLRPAMEGPPAGRIAAAMAELLTADQRGILTSLVEEQQFTLQTYQQQRGIIAAALSGLKHGEKLDRKAVLDRAEEVGRLEGQLILLRADAFARLAATLTPAQSKELADLRRNLPAPPKAAESKPPAELPPGVQ